MTADTWPFRHVALSCEHPDCFPPAVIDADVRAETSGPAYAALRQYARELGWDPTPDRELCPAHALSAPEPAPAALLGLPGAEQEEPAPGGS